MTFCNILLQSLQALAFTSEQSNQNILGAAYVPIEDFGMGGDSSVSPYRAAPAPYATAMHTVTPVHHYPSSQRSSAKAATGAFTTGYSSSHPQDHSYKEHSYGGGYSGVSPDLHTGPSTSELLGTTKTSPFLATNRAHTSSYTSSAYPPSTDNTKSYDAMERVRRLGIDKDFNGDITFLSRLRGSDSPTVNEIDLDELDYYTLVDTKRTTTTTTTGKMILFMIMHMFI